MWLSTDTKKWHITLPQQRNWRHFACRVAAARLYIRASAGQRWLLQQTQREDFRIWLLALLCENRTPLLPSNGQPETINALRPYADHSVPTELLETYTNDSTSDILTGSLDTEIILYTSGSNGDPKAVHKTMRQLINEVQTLELTFGQQLEGCDIVATITHQHIYGLLFTVLWPLCAGRHVATTQIDYPEQLQWLHAQQMRPYALISTPAHLERFTQVMTLCDFADSLRAVFSSGGPLSAWVPKQFLSAQLTPPIEVYGSTETGGIAWRQCFTEKQPFQVFTPIHIAVDTNQQLQIKSPHLADMNWYTTSDKVEFLNSTQFIINGRADRVVKLAEKRLSLDEMEIYAETLSWVARAKCCLLEQKPRSQLGIVLTLNTQGLKLQNEVGSFGLRKALRRHLSQRFEPVVLPRKFRYVKQLPYNDTGKLTLSALRQLFVEDTKE